MADEMRAMLDQLMGKDRDVPLSQRTARQAKFSDPEVCKHALAGLCPYGLFQNTRSDLGPCPQEIHEDHLDWEALAAEYNALPEREKDRYGYERALYRQLQRLVDDMDRKIDKARERAHLESMPRPLAPAQQQEVDALRTQAKDLTEQSEKMAEQGDVDASMAAVAQAERLHADADALAKRYSQPERTLEVCEVCGVFIQSTENESARREIMSGRQYQGWLAIREKHRELAAKYGPGGGHAPLGPAADPREREEGEVGRAAEPPRRRSRSRSRSRGDRDRGRDYRSSSYRDDRDRRRRSRSRDRRDRRYDYDDRRDDRRRGDRY